MIPHRGGLPHSDTSGSTPARGSPKIFAACHVLLRLLAPRHPPDALLLLKNPSCSHTTSLAQDPSNKASVSRPSVVRGEPQNASARSRRIGSNHTHTLLTPERTRAAPQRPTRQQRAASIRAVPSTPKGATEPDSQSPKNTTQTLTNG
jgi:hypothetical protein